jgi:hypothetical protein
LQRIGIQVGCEVLTVFGVFLGKETVVEANLGIYGIWLAYPVKGALYLSAIGRIASLGLGIIRAS